MTKDITITKTQDALLYKIAENNGWREDEISKLISPYGYKLTSEIKVVDYENICNSLKTLNNSRKEK